MPRLPQGPVTVQTGVLARILMVDPSIVSRWAQAGKLPFQRTLGGNRRYFLAECLVVVLVKQPANVDWAIQHCRENSVPLPELTEAGRKHKLNIVALAIDAKLDQATIRELMRKPG